MKKFNLNSRIFDDWPVKVVCVLFALLLYFFHQVTSLDSKNIAVPLQVESGGIVVPVNDIPHYIRVTFRGKPDDVSMLSENDIQVVLDVSSFVESGKYQVPLRTVVSKSASLLEPLEIILNPDTIEVELQKYGEKFIALEPTIIGDLPKGYELDAISLNPKFIYTSGPENLIGKIDKVITEPVALDGRTKDFVQKVYPINKNTHIFVDKNQEVEVFVAIKQKIETKKIIDIPIEISNLQPVFDAKLEQSKVVMSLKGLYSELENYSISKVYVDASSISEIGTYTLPVLYQISDNLVLEHLAPNQVTVLVTEKQKTVEDEQVE